MMIDFHVLLHPTQQRTPYFITHPKAIVHRVPGTVDHIGQGRYKGFLKGDCPYVSFYDDDGDQVIESAIDVILGVLERDPSIDAVCTQEWIQRGYMQPISKTAFTEPTKVTLERLDKVHHLVVLRRSVLNKYLENLHRWKIHAEPALWYTMINDGCNFLMIPEYGYVWKPHKGSAHRVLAELVTEEQLNFQTARARSVLNAPLKHNRGEH